MCDNKIITLKGPERVRKRPQVIFGSEDVQGAWQAVRSLLEIYVTEALLGHCQRLSVKQDGETVEISGDDRGLYLGQDTGEDAPWQQIFCEMYPLPAYRPEEGEYSLGLLQSTHHMLYGDQPTPDSVYYPDERGYFELYTAQCVCKAMDVTVCRAGVRSVLHFEKGENVGGITHIPTTDRNGTAFRLVLDREVFTETVIPARLFLNALETFAILIPGLSCTYENAKLRKHFCYPEGSAGYVQSKSGVPAYAACLAAKGRERYNRAEYAARVEVAIGYTPNAGGVKCLHNFRELTHGGSHLKALEESLCAAFNSCYRTKLEGAPVKLRELRRHLTVLLVSQCHPYSTLWVNGARTGITNQVIGDMTTDVMKPAFENFVYAHKAQFSDLIDRILAERIK